MSVERLVILLGSVACVLGHMALEVDDVIALALDTIVVQVMGMGVGAFSGKFLFMQ